MDSRIKEAMTLAGQKVLKDIGARELHILCETYYDRHETN